MQAYLGSRFVQTALDDPRFQQEPAAARGLVCARPTSTMGRRRRPRRSRPARPGSGLLHRLSAVDIPHVGDAFGPGASTVVMAVEHE